MAKTKRRINYTEVYKRLQPFHKFSFRLRKSFTSQQKSAIYKKWFGVKNKEGYEIVKGLRNIVDEVDKKQAIFKKLPRKKINRLKSQYVHTNKGIFVFGLDIGKKKNRVRIIDKKIGRKIETRVVTYRTMYKEVYYPKRDKKLTIVEHINRVFEDKKPFSIALAVNKYHGRRIMTYKDWLRYEPTMDKIENEVTQRTGDTGTPFIGAYGMYFKGGYEALQLDEAEIQPYSERKKRKEEKKGKKRKKSKRKAKVRKK